MSRYTDTLPEPRQGPGPDTVDAPEVVYAPERAVASAVLHDRPRQHGPYPGKAHEFRFRCRVHGQRAQ